MTEKENKDLEKQAIYLETYANLITTSGLNDTDATILSKVIAEVYAEGNENLTDRLVNAVMQSDLKYRYPFHLPETEKIFRIEIAKAEYNFHKDRFKNKFK